MTPLAQPMDVAWRRGASRRTMTALVVTFGVLLSCGPPAKQFELRGIIVDIDVDTGKVTVEHQEIRDFMEPMTMPFRVLDRTILEDLRPGDPIRAILVVRGNASWLEDVEVVPSPSP